MRGPTPRPSPTPTRAERGPIEERGDRRASPGYAGAEDGRGATTVVVGLLVSLIFGVPDFAISAEIRVREKILAYTVQIDSIDRKYLPKGSGATSVISFTITPAKFNPKEVILHANGASWDILDITQGGSYTTELIEGTDLTDTKQYDVKIQVDKANSNIEQVFVFDFIGETTPNDNFSGRSLTKYGIAERVALTSVITPNTVSAADIGGLEWKIFNGVGALAAATSVGTAEYDAGSSAGSVELRLELKTGPSQGVYRSYSRSIVAPSGGYMIRVPGSGLYHIYDTASVGFQGYSYLLPKDVSFDNIEAREGTAVGVGSGFYAYQNGIVHPIGTWVNVGGCNSSTGCTDFTVDTVQAAPKSAPYSVGDFLWPIPWEYRVGAGSAISYYMANHHKTADAVGRCCMEKAGAGPFCKNALDPTSSY